jgi:hypothetical protein
MTYIVTTCMKIGLEVLSLWSIYQLQRIQNNADENYDKISGELKPLKFSEVWLIPEKYACHVGKRSHSACSQV